MKSLAFVQFPIMRALLALGTLTMIQTGISSVTASVVTSSTLNTTVGGGNGTDVSVTSTASVSMSVTATSPPTASGGVPPVTTLPAESPTSTASVNVTTTITGVTSGNGTDSTSTTASPTGNATSTSTSTLPTATITDPDVLTVVQRRNVFVVSQQGHTTSVATWSSTLQPDGTWLDVNYLSGCPAQTANWPAEEHWTRIGTLSAAWHGGFKSKAGFVKNETLRAQIGLAMDWWFARDFTNPSCLDMGGTASCPCDTPGLWNTNWFSNVIGVSRLVGQVCLLLGDSLTTSQQSNCTNITLRSYSIFHRDVKPGFLAGANTLDIASIGITGGILSNNASTVAESYGFVHDEVQVQVGFQKDGILPDGSFAQHGGLLYNGNYGKDYTNDVLELEIEAGGTRFAAEGSSRAAFESLMDASQWMIYENTLTGVLHWDFNTEGRFISFPVIDAQATEDIKINLTEVQELAELWSSNTLTDVADGLTNLTGTANVGGLVGNRMFWNSDYMVTRGKNYVSGLKMYSSRVHNAECTNNQNPFGFHMADGTLYTYITGDEYEDIAPAIDWNMFPGITVDYNATVLSCDTENVNGLEDFVGGVSTGSIGAAVMRYTNPLTRAFSFQKAWFFFPDDIHHVSVSILKSTTTAPVFSILDQRKRSGNITVGIIPRSNATGNYSDPRLLFHDQIGYTFSPSVSTLSIATGPRTGDWSSLGISTQPPPTVDLFAAWLPHEDLDVPLSYSIFPGRSDAKAFFEEAITSPITIIQSDTTITAVQDVLHAVAMIVFWQPDGGQVRIPPAWRAPSITSVRITSDEALVLMLEEKNGWTVSVSDPTQTLDGATLAFEVSPLPPKGWGRQLTKTVQVAFPTEGMAGSSVQISLLDL